MRRIGLITAAFSLTFMAIVASAQDDKKKKKDVGPTPDVALKTSGKFDGRPDTTNYIHYFTWLKLYDYEKVVRSHSPCVGEKWMLAKIVKGDKAKGSIGSKAIQGKAEKDMLPAKVTIEASFDVAYKPSKFEGKIVAHIYAGTVQGSIKDETGKVIKKIDLKHRWGANIGVERRKIKVEYMRYLTKWILIDLYETPEFRKTCTAEDLVKIDAEIKTYKEEKEKLYDDEWK